MTFETNVATEVEALIGMEVRATIRRGQPIKTNDVGAPILIHRGRSWLKFKSMVVEFASRPTPNRLGDGADSDLIEVETLQPRRRMVARVVAPGVVEILTRAPYRSIAQLPGREIK